MMEKVTSQDLFGSAPLYDLRAARGGAGRRRGRAQSGVDGPRLWANRAIVGLQELDRGSFTGRLLSGEADHPQSVGDAESHPLSSRVLTEVGRQFARRPSDLPTGADLLEHQRGVAPDASLPHDSTLSGGLIPPKRGQIWPAQVEAIALPVREEDPVSMIQHSPRCARYLSSLLAMQKSPEELAAEPADGVPEKPYVDPLLRRQMLKLAVRLARGRMLRGTPRCDSEVGLFTVIKKATLRAAGDGYDIELRLVFDERQPNRVWRTPPWTALGGPGAWSSLDLSAFRGRSGGSFLMATGDIPNYYYVLRLPEEFASWFCLPEVRAGELRRRLDEEGLAELGRVLEEQAGGPDGFLGLQVPCMGWNWAVFLAQSFLQDQLERLPQLHPGRFVVEGAPSPEVSPSEPWLGLAHIDDFGLGRWVETEGHLSELIEMRDTFKQRLFALGLGVHKEDFGEFVVLLGMELDGKDPRITSAGEKLWTAAECLWAMAQEGFAYPRQVESVVALSNWIAMVNRGLLSVIDYTYTWVRENREVLKKIVLPREVREELAVLGALIPLVSQDLTAEWASRVYMMDASLWGGGICVTDATLEEVREEGRWGGRGHWLLLGCEDEIGAYWHRLQEKRRDSVMQVPLEIPRGMCVRHVGVAHIFSGLRREHDLAWYLLRLGGLAGWCVHLYLYDLAYGPEYDLASRDVVDHLLEEIGSRRVRRAHLGPPCSTWSRARFRPGGPPPLRTRSSPWGRPGLSRDQQDRCDLHSLLVWHSWEILEELHKVGGGGTLEHPIDPGSDPFPSMWGTSEFADFAQMVEMETVSFPQCALGQAAKKETTLGFTPKVGAVRSRFEGLRCTHRKHASLEGKDEKGVFKTRAAQSYPAEMCKQLAQAIIESLDDDDDCISLAQPYMPDTEDAAAVPPGLGEKVPCPEIRGCWDTQSRWWELRRWQWQKHEHVNILETRVALASLLDFADQPYSFGKRVLMLSDSQVAIGVLSKGRSSSRPLNRLARRAAARRLAFQIVPIWRYVPTHRNHADAPSRNLPWGTMAQTDKHQECDEGRGGLPLWFIQCTSG